MGKLRLDHVLANLAQTYTGMEQGRIAAEQEQRRRAMQQQEVVRQSHQTMLSILPSLDRASRERLLGGVMGEQDRMARGLPFDFQQPAQPDWRVPPPSMLASSPPAAAAPATARPAAMPLEDVAPMASGAEAPELTMPTMSPARAAMGMGGLPTLERTLTQVEAPQYVTAKTLPKAAPPPAPAPAAPAGRTIPSRYGPLSLQGVDPKEADALRKSFGDLDKWFGEQKLTDQQKRDTGEWIREFPKQIETEEDLGKARRVVENLRVSRVGLGKFAQTQAFAEEQAGAKALGDQLGDLSGMTEDQLFQVLPGLWERARSINEGGRVVAPVKLMAAGRNIEAMMAARKAGDAPRAMQLARVIRGTFGSALKPAEETARMNSAIRLLGEMDPKSRMDPDTVRTVFRNFGIEHLIEGVGEGSLRFGTQELEERWSRMVADLPRWAGAPAGRSKVFFNELVGLGRLLGRRVPLSPGDMFKLDEETLAKIARDETRFQWQQEDRTTTLAIEALRLKRAQIGLQIDQKRLAKASKPDQKGFTVNQQAEKLNGIYGKAVAEYGNFLLDNYMTEAAFDPAKPKNDLEKKAAAKWQKMEQSKKNYYNFLTKNGMDPALLEQAGANAPEPGGKTETGAAINELANPSRPENRKAAPAPGKAAPARSAAPTPTRRMAIGNAGRLTVKQRMYNRYRKEGFSEADARKFAEQDAAALRPQAR